MPYVKKAVYNYEAWRAMTQEELSYMADHFDLLVFDGGWWQTPEQMATIKNRNPKAVIFGYKNIMGIYEGTEDWAVVNANESWFVHDTAGNRIRNTQFGWWLLDPASGWRGHFLSYVNSKINYPYYDVLFIDDVYSMWPQWMNSSLSSLPDASVMARWASDTRAMLQYVKANLVAGKLVVVNGAEWGSYLDITDGYCAEGFTHGSGNDLSYHGTTEHIMYDIDLIAHDSATGAIIWLASGAMPTGDVEQTAKFCYVAALLAANGSNVYFSFNNFNSADGNRGYYPFMDVDVGSPTGAYYISQNVYMRDYTGGKVLFNPSGNSYTVNLGGNYKLLDGTVVSSIIMEPWTGEILLAEVPPTPPIEPLFPRVREIASAFPRITAIYTRIDEIRLKRVEGETKEGVL